jgi:hypothetical protein
VRIVAIRTGNDSFVHPMFGGHVELRSNRGVTFVAEIGLLFGEQRLRTDRPMNGMATGTGDVVLGVLRATDLGPADVFGVAGEAGVQDALRRQLAESDDRGLAASSLYVRFSGGSSPDAIDL